MKHQNYSKTTTTATFQGKTITVTHLTPILSLDEQEKRTLEIEHQLHDVLAKCKKSDVKVG